jgi:hypothetical protein
MVPGFSNRAEKTMKGAHVKRSYIGLFCVIAVIVASLIGTGSPADAQVDGPEATIEALLTRVAELEGTVEARGEKINAQRTQIADLRSQLPVVNEDPAIGDVFAISNFEFTVQGTNVLDAVGDFDPQEANGIYLVVYLDVKNVSDRPRLFPYDDFEVVDGQRRTYSFDDMAAISLLIFEMDQMMSIYDELQPGVITSTAVIFDVPVEATGFTLTNKRGDFEAPLDR